MAKDPFKSLRPKKDKVAVGDEVLELRTSTLDQETELMAAIGELDLGSLFGPLSEMLSSEDDESGTTVKSILQRMGKLGPQLWSAAQTLLGRQLAPALRDGCIAVLHTPGNAQLLKKADKITSEGAFDNDGVFTCPELKAFLRQNLTLVQASAVLRKAWDLNAYGEALGNLLPLLAPEEPAPESPTTAQSAAS